MHFSDVSLKQSHFKYFATQCGPCGWHRSCVARCHNASDPGIGTEPLCEIYYTSAIFPWLFADDYQIQDSGSGLFVNALNTGTSVVSFICGAV